MHTIVLLVGSGRHQIKCGKLLDRSAAIVLVPLGGVAGRAGWQDDSASGGNPLDHRALNRNRNADSNCAGSDLRRKDDRA